MSRPKPQWLIAVFSLLSIPFIFNSCQGGLLGSKGFASKSACVAQNGKVSKLPIESTNIFAGQKVKLRNDLENSDVRSKATGDLSLSAGERLSLIADNQCLRLQTSNPPVISQQLLVSGQMIEALDRQAYEWVLPQAYTDRELEQLANQEPCVIGLSWNRSYKLQTSQAPPLTFDDPSKIYQTHLQSIRAESAYDLFYRNGGMPQTGNPIVVAVIDSGVDYQHPDLAGNIFAHSLGVGIDITSLGGQVNYYPSDISSIGHGTHVAGLIGAIANNTTGVMGAMPYRVKIMPIRLFRLDANGDLSTTSQFFYNALQYAYLNKAHVANLSIGSITAGPATDSVAFAGVREAVEKNMVVITVIGNADGGANGQEVNGTTLSSIPGQYSNQAGVIGVGSFDVQSGAKSFFSHYSTTFVEISAPGADQGSTGIFSTLPVAMSSYGRLAGTSQAGPLVSAAAALAVGLVHSKTGVYPTAAEVERLVVQSASPSSQLASFFKNGNRLDLVNLAQKINSEYGSGSVLASASCQ